MAINIIVRGQVRMLAQQMAQVIRKQQVIGQQGIQRGHVGSHHGQAQALFRIEHLYFS